MKTQFLFGQLPILFGQVAPDSNGAATDATNTDVGIPDKTGEIDFSVKSIWETLDNMVDGLIDRLPFIVVGVVIFVAFFFIAGFARRMVRKFTEDKESANLGRVLGRIAQWVLIFVGLMIAVAVMAPSVTPAKLLTTLGVGGVAIGFAFKDILQNFMAGLLILLREPFRIGDQIISGDYEGTVESIETRATMIKTYDGRRVVIPNSQIYTNPVVVNTAFDSQRTQYDVGIGYGDDLREGIRVILSAVKSVDGVLRDPAPDVLVAELAGSTVNLRARWWSAPDRASVVNVSHEVIARIKEALDEAQIDMPYPTQVLLIHDQTEEWDGDRTRQREGWPAGDDPPKPRTISGAIGHFDSASSIR
jgi:small-conductance mechanosensitive channel